MTETFFVAFDYEVIRLHRYGGTGLLSLRRDTIAVEVMTLRKADLPVAHRVRDHRGLGRGHHSILRHNERLWWLLVDSSYSWDIKMERDLLQALRAGRSDLFLRLPLDRHFAGRNIHLVRHGRTKRLQTSTAAPTTS